jgi:hypothetical protein
MRIDAKVGEQAEGWTCVGVGVVDDFYDFTDSAPWVGDISLGFMELDIAAEDLGGHVRALVDGADDEDELWTLLLGLRLEVEEGAGSPPRFSLWAEDAEGIATREAFKEIQDVALWRLQQLAPEALRPQVVAAGDDMDRVVELLRGACVRVPVISWE